MTNALSEDRPTTIVIFGASGDLTRRKLVPALFRQFTKGRLTGELHIVGIARSPMDEDEFRIRMRQDLEALGGVDPDEEQWNDFAGKLRYLRGDAGEISDYKKLDDFLRELEGGSANRLYYLATAPFLFAPIVNNLGKTGMAAENGGWRRVVVEKPFGSDLESAKSLNRDIHQVFAEHQVYRIDHYLGKDTAQNILYFRFLNTIFEPIWNRNYIDHVQISVTESVDVGHRAGYYDQAGVLRDMFQNHMLQLLTLIAMEPPAKFDADAVRNEKVKVLRAMRPVDLEETVRAQYRGYVDIEGVAPESQTPTFAALKTYVDNWRWKDVPFYLRSGKGLASKISEVVIEFERPPHVMFELPEDYDLTPNYLSLCIQPDEGIHLRFETKVPGSVRETRSAELEFHYRSSFAGEILPDAYERLLLDALKGDASLFTRSDEIELAWGLVDPIIEGWGQSADVPPLAKYDLGSQGPSEADQLLHRSGRAWRLACAGHEE